MATLGDKNKQKTSQKQAKNKPKTSKKQAKNKQKTSFYFFLYFL
jgi:hypothetical protein